MSEASPVPLTGSILPGGRPLRLELDKKALFALASDTRLEILKALEPMRRTVTQLSNSLEIDKAAIYRHLKKLEEGEFVKRYEDHGFVYYGLTWKARDLLDPKENTRIVILISCAWAFLLGAVIVLAFAMSPGPTPLSQFDEGANQEGFTADLDQGIDLALILISILLVGVAIYLVGRGLRVMRPPKQPASIEEQGSD